MIPSRKRLELFFWSVLPGVITACLLIVYLTPKHIAGLGHFMPLLPLIPVFYWGLLRAREMPYWFVFGVGLIMDAAVGLPLGLTALLYVIFLGLLHAQRKYILKEGFVVKWGYFAALLLATAVLNWLLMLFLSGQVYGVLPALIQWLLTVCCYPLLHKFFDWLCEYAHARRWQILHGR